MQEAELPRLSLFSFVLIWASLFLSGIVLELSDGFEFIFPLPREGFCIQSSIL